jgi:hypothetical protein
MTKNLSTHVASILSAAGAVITIVHPGFQIPVGTQSVVATLCVLIAGGLQFFHTIAKQKLSSDFVAAEAWLKHFVNNEAATPEVTPKP